MHLDGLSREACEPVVGPRDDGSLNTACLKVGIGIVALGGDTGLKLI